MPTKKGMALDKQKAHFAINEILQQMYAEAMPPIDWKFISTSNYIQQDGWQDKHTLSAKRAEEIEQEIVKKYRLRVYWSSYVSFAVMNLCPKLC